MDVGYFNDAPGERRWRECARRRGRFIAHLVWLLGHLALLAGRVQLHGRQLIEVHAERGLRQEAHTQGKASAQILKTGESRGRVTRRVADRGDLTAHG